MSSRTRDTTCVACERPFRVRLLASGDVPARCTPCEHRRMQAQQRSDRCALDGTRLVFESEPGSGVSVTRCPTCGALERGPRAPRVDGRHALPFAAADVRLRAPLPPAIVRRPAPVVEDVDWELRQEAIAALAALPPTASTGERLAALLTTSCTTLAAVARTVGVTPQAVAYWRDRSTLPTDGHRAALARYFGVTVRAIFGDAPARAHAGGRLPRRVQRPAA